ncbi:DegT/DnrJ/EryC1/StrS family aminotransferase [Vibrio vulnificus]|nr:DegT/DnrJ/EryC1/StrS family aminotransferase [Vibrio vulnificus]EJE8580372.1 DegT/DnrJ/EryC1/StrS family aminotransferase [Vibrio vulnificus]
MIALNRPIQPNLKTLTRYLDQVHELGWYTNFGPLHQQLTERLEEYLKVENLLLVSNGTLAIQVACKAMNVDNALTTPFSFVATTSSLLWQSIDVGFCDIDPNSLNLSPSTITAALQKSNNYDAIVATHVYGNPCDVKSIEQISNQYNKKVIYDAAHAFGVNVGNKSVLSFGDASTLSFHATKVFHTVEGGAIVFKNRDDFDFAKKLINFGIESDGSLGKPGINAKLNEYQSAVGLTLLDDIDNVLEHRIALFEWYRAELNGVLEMPVWHIEANFNGAYMPVICDSEEQLKGIMEHLSLRGIQSRKYFSPSLDLAYPCCESDGCEVSQQHANKMLCLPLHFFMTKQDIKTIAKEIREFLR